MVNFFKSNLSAEMCGMIALYGEFFNQIPGVIVIHDHADASITFVNDIGLQKTGLSGKVLEQLTIDAFYAQFFESRTMQDHVSKMKIFLENNPEDAYTAYQQIKFLPDRHSKWYLSNVKVFMRGSDGRPLLTLSMHLPLEGISDIPVQVKRLLEDNDFQDKNQQLFSRLSKREIDVLKEVALGKTSVQIGDKLFIAATTVDTHRRNIRKKLNIRSFFEITHYAKTFNLI